MVQHLTAPALSLVILFKLFSFAAAATVAHAADLPTVIDTHIHLYDPTRPGGIPWPRQGHELYRTYMPAEFAAVAEPAGVSAAVIVEASPLVEDNQWMLDLMEDEPSLVALVGRLDLRSDSFKADLARFAANPRFSGIRRNVVKADLADERIMTNLRDLQARKPGARRGPWTIHDPGRCPCPCRGGTGSAHRRQPPGKQAHRWHGSGFCLGE